MSAISPASAALIDERNPWLDAEMEAALPKQPWHVAIAAAGHWEPPGWWGPGQLWPGSREPGRGNTP